MLKEMQRAHVGLSVLTDTIGSNVICTSLACGLAQVVSDVGSIRDYCSDENSFLCTTVDDFVSALERLSTDRQLCERMGKAARRKAEEISLDRSIEWLGEQFGLVASDE